MKNKQIEKERKVARNARMKAIQDKVKELMRIVKPKSKGQLIK